MANLLSPQSRTQRAEAWVLGNQFTAVAGSVAMLEIVLGAWPVVATALWKSHAVDTWIHFFWWIKAFFLMLAVCQQYWAARRKRNKYNSKRQTKVAGGVSVTSPSTTFELCVGATASCELSTWIMISVVGHALLSGILLLLVLVLRSEFLSNTEWVLSLVFNVVGIVESIGSPVLVTSLSIRSAAPLPPLRRRHRRAVSSVTKVTSKIPPPHDPVYAPRTRLPVATHKTAMAPLGRMAAAYGL